MSAGAICDSRIVRKLLGRLINFPTLRDDGTIVFHRVYKRKRAMEERRRRRSPILHFFCIGILLKAIVGPFYCKRRGAHYVEWGYNRVHLRHRCIFRINLLCNKEALLLAPFLWGIHTPNEYIPL